MKKIEWNKVTKLSQIVAIVLFVLVYYYGFYLGRQTGITKILGTPTADAVFVCDAGKSVHAVFYQSGVRVGFPEEPETFLLQTISASGARYANADESLVFWNKGDEAMIESNGKADPNFKKCKTK